MRLVLFGTSGCHLCEQAEEIIHGCLAESVEYIDIAEQPEWQERYAIRIPVLYDRDTEQELGWPFGQAEVMGFIERVERSPYVA
ncbi:MAG: glutaredoxin family protein [Methylobacter sp.]